MPPSLSRMLMTCHPVSWNSRQTIPAGFGREFDCVRHQVVRYLTESFTVNERVNRLLWQFEPYVERLQFHLGLSGLGRVSHALSEIDQNPAKFDLADLPSIEVEQILDEKR